MDGLKKLNLLTGIVLLMILAVLCVVGSVMGADWSKWFFTSPAGRGIGGCIGLLILVGLFEFKDVCRTRWPLAVYAGALLVLAAGFINCSCTVFAGYLIGCVGLFGLLWVKPDKIDIVTAVLLFLAIVFVFSFRSLSPQLKSIFFVPHVFTCLLSYIFVAAAAFFAVKCLFDESPQTENKSYRYICLAFPLLTAGIVLGSIWAAFAWDDWWGWDPKEMFSLAVWLVLAAFLHFRYLYRQRFLRLNSIWIITGFMLIILSVSLVNFLKIFAGLHSHTG